jgi:hypothetical protein
MDPEDPSFDRGDVVELLAEENIRARDPFARTLPEAIEPAGAIDEEKLRACGQEVAFDAAERSDVR